MTHECSFYCDYAHDMHAFLVLTTPDVTEEEVYAIYRSCGFEIISVFKAREADETTLASLRQEACCLHTREYGTSMLEGQTDAAVQALVARHTMPWMLVIRGKIIENGARVHIAPLPPHTGQDQPSTAS